MKKRNPTHDTIIDANLGYPELKRRDPELYKLVIDRQRAVAQRRRRSARSPRLRRKIG